MSCSDYIMAPLPKDFPVVKTDTIDEIPVDTITLPLEDTCEQYHQITQPEFLCFFVNLDLPLTDSTIYYNNSVINPEIFFDELHFSGINIGGIIDGTNFTSDYNAKVWVRDGSGAKHFLAFYTQGIYFRGALTFDETMEVLQARPSARFINFSNTGFTCDQINQVIDFLLQDCKEGIPGVSIVDLRPVDPTCVEPDEISELEARNWTVWQ